MTDRPVAGPRRRFAGVSNIVRFNWVAYATATTGVATNLLLARMFPSKRRLFVAAATSIGSGVAASLAASHWVYDRSSLYDLRWSEQIVPSDHVLVVHAGFDEISEPLCRRLGRRVDVYDFHHDLARPTPSIRRAQRAPIVTGESPPVGLPRGVGRYDWIIAFMCLHEIRDEQQRRQLLRQLADGLASDARIVVVEHLRDLPNALAFSVGFTHFMTRSSWLADFAVAGITPIEETKVTPLVTEFILTRTT